MSHRLTARINDFLFGKSSALNLGFCRFVFCLWITCVNWPGFIFQEGRSYWLGATLPTSLWRPISFFTMFSHPPIDVAQAALLLKIGAISLVSATLGFYSRVSCLIAAVCLGLANGDILCYGIYGHVSQLWILVLVIFSCSRCGDSFSVDAVLRSDSFLRTTRAVAYGWPVKLICLTHCLVYVSAAISKIRNSGFEWVFSEQLQNYFLRSAYDVNYLLPAVRHLEIGLFFARNPYLCHAIAVIILLTELLAPLVLIPRFRAMVLVLFMMHMMVPLTLVSAFFGYLGIYLCWIPWDKVFLSFGLISDSRSEREA